MESFNLIKEEIKREGVKNSKIKFNLIASGNDLENNINIISNDNEISNFIENKCIYCSDLLKYEDYKIKYQYLINDNIYNKKEDIIDFIHRTSNENINPFKINELITYTQYVKKYHLKHKEMLKYFDDLDEIKYNKYYEELEKFINNKKLKIEKDIFLNGFKYILNDNFLSIFINNIYEDLNKFIIENINIEECISYFTARIITNFQKYRHEKNKFYNWEKEIYFGTNLKLSELLQIKGRISFQKFVIFYEKKEIAEQLANREQSKQYYKDNLKFSVIFIIKKKEINCDGINIEDLYINKEKAILFLPFTFFQLEDIKFDFTNYTADVYI